MKRKLFNQICCFSMAAMTLFSSVPVYAATDNQTVIDDSSTDVIINGVDSRFSVTVPKNIVGNGSSGTLYYDVTIEGDIAGNEHVTVVPDESVTLSQKNKSDVVANISQDKMYWNADEFATVGNGVITYSELSAGDYNGVFNFNIALEEGSGSEVESVLTLSADDIAIGTNTSAQVNAYLDGELVNEFVDWSSDNEDIVVTDGLVETSASAKVGDTAIVTVSADLSPVAMFALYDDEDIMPYSNEANLLSTSFSVTVVDMAYTVDGDTEVITSLDIKPGENKTVEVAIIPASSNGTVVWSTTATSGLNLVTNGNRVTVKVASDMPVGNTYDLVATYGNFSKLLKINIISDHVHSYTESVTSATCTQDGLKTFTCECGDSYTETLPATGHTFGAWITVKDPSCTEDGSKHRVCTICNYMEIDSLAATGHSWEADYTVDKAATCTEDGSKSIHCADCDATKSSAVIPATGHSYNSGVVTTEPTCTVDGVKTYTCSVCGNTKTEAVSKLGHNYVASVTAPTCTDEGYTTHTCSRCNDSYVDSEVSATGHSYGSWTTTKEATCIVDGSKQRTCATCGDVATAVITKLGHNYSSTYTIDKAATCTETGSKSQHCSRCDSKQNVTTIPATGHNYGIVSYSWSSDKSTCTASRICSECSNVESEKVNSTNSITTAATCTAAGARTYTAKFTNSAFATQTTTVAISANGHTSVSANNAVAATCTTAGKQSDTKCSVCGVTITTGTTIPATGHNYGPVTYSWSADGKTCTATRTCANDSSHVETEAATVTSTVKTAATCTTKGTTTYTATFTNAAFTKQTKDVQDILALEHNYGSWITIQEATCSEEGSKQRTCVVCGNIETEIISKTNHNVVNGYCTICNEKIAGLYNSNGILLCAWEDSGIKVNTSYSTTSSATNYYKTTTTSPYYVLVNRYPATTKVVLPDDITYIGINAFRDCTKLTNIDVPSGLKNIGNYAFYNCTNLTSITIPSGVTSIGTEVFYNCTGEVIINCDIPSVSSSSYSKFSGSKFTKVTFGDDVTDIGDYLFTECTSLKTVKIGNNANRVGLYAFKNCTGLTTVTMGRNVISIYGSAFYGCTGLTSIALPNNLTTIGSYAFKGCTGLTSITIPSKVTTIGGYAFGDCTNLTGSITIPSGVTKIESDVFINCAKLTKVTIPSSVTSIGDSAFKNCTSLTSVTIPSNVTHIRDYAFKGCTGLTSITIPDSVTFIGQAAFNGCTSVTSVTIGSGITSMKGYAFENCSSLKYLTIKSGAKVIGDYAFRSCKNLTNFTIPSSVTSIGDAAFMYCNSLTSMTIGGGVTTIGSTAFGYCTGLTSVTIPSSVTSIEQFAFSGCSNLANATFKTKTGWYVGASAGAKTTSISRKNLSNTSTAATYLKTTYYAKYWTR